MREDLSSRPLYITHEDANRLIPFFEAAVRSAPYEAAKASAIRILRELRSVRSDVEYEPFGGKQIFLNPTDRAWLEEVMETLGM